MPLFCLYRPTFKIIAGFLLEWTTITKNLYVFNPKDSVSKQFWCHSNEGGHFLKAVYSNTVAVFYPPFRSCLETARSRDFWQSVALHSIIIDKVIEIICLFYSCGKVKGISCLHTEILCSENLYDSCEDSWTGSTDDKQPGKSILSRDPSASYSALLVRPLRLPSTRFHRYCLYGLHSKLDSAAASLILRKNFQSVRIIHKGNTWS